MEVFMICALCKKDTELRKSHFIELGHKGQIEKR